MDKEWQIRLNFLDEAEEYFDKMESNLLGLGSSEIDTQKVDVVLRAAHSIKGGAAMMGFLPLSRTAHRIEDFLKILRVRYRGKSIDVAVETLLLQSIDALRQLGSINRQGQEIQTEELDQKTQSLFDQLQGYLGDLAESDEDALLNQDEDVDPALLLFEDGVEAILTEFETVRQSSSIEELQSLLISTAQELIAFGNMAKLDSFCQLCQSIEQLAAHTPLDAIQSLSTKALKSWKRSHSLVLRGSIDKLPSQLEGIEAPPQSSPPRPLGEDIFGSNESLNDSSQSHEELQVDSFELADIDLSLFDVQTDEVEMNPIAQLDSFDIADDLETGQFEALQSSFDLSSNPVIDDLNNVNAGEGDSSQSSSSDEELQIDHFELANIDPSSFDLLLDEVESTPIESLESFNLVDDPQTGESAPLPSGDKASSNPDFPETINPANADTFSFPPSIMEEEDSHSKTRSNPLMDLDSTDDVLQNAFAEADITTSTHDSNEKVIQPLDANPLTTHSSQEDNENTSTELEASQEQILLPKQTQVLLEGICQRLALDPSILYALIDQQAPTISNEAGEQQNATAEKMVRVPASQLKQFNSLFEQLILNRNSINLKLLQFQNMIQLMGQRIKQIENSNVQLKQWYDRASLEGFLNNSDDRSSHNRSRSNNQEVFDSLEMDRYSNIHLICQAQIETIVQLQEVATDITLGLSDISQSVDTLNYTTQSMQGNVTRTQMIPFKEVIKRCPRMIRDLNLQYDKQVVLEILGETTLLDRRVAEVLNDPLMHLLRNAFDHGIEEADRRTQQGKNPQGRIIIQASNQGTYTVVTIQDDGAGLPLDKIRDRIVQMGIPREDVEKIPEADLLEFIFEPGFSTAEKVTELSGRGVGMDVVKTNLDEIQGNIRVSSEPGQGTTFTIRIPYTLSILRVAVVEQDGMIFAIPANAIQEMFEFETQSIQTTSMIPSLSWMEESIPVLELEKALVFNRAHQMMRLTGSPTIDKPMAIVVKNNHRHAALKVTRFWYEQESTIRPIDSPIPLPTGIISSVVFGDGKVIPLIDPGAIIDPYINALSDPNHDIQTNAQVESYPTSQSILIVDDSVNVRRYLAHTLEKAGYLVEQAKDGQEAVEKLMDGLAVNAVICDIEMPRLDGYGVLEEIKGQSQFDDLPVVMLTSRSNEKHRKIAMNLGATDYFSKPYNESELLEKLSELTQSKVLVSSLH